MSEESFYERCLKKFTALMEDAREQGDYPLFSKWEIEVNNYRALIKMEEDEKVRKPSSNN
jgi:hypothetical protein